MLSVVFEADGPQVMLPSKRLSLLSAMLLVAFHLQNIIAVDWYQFMLLG